MFSEQDGRYLIRDQDWDVRRPLDLLQAWGPPAREPFRVRLGRILVVTGQRLQGMQSSPHVPFGVTKIHVTLEIVQPPEGWRQ